MIFIILIDNPSYDAWFAAIIVVYIILFSSYYRLVTIKHGESISCRKHHLPLCRYKFNSICSKQLLELWELIETSIWRSLLYYWTINLIILPMVWGIHTYPYSVCSYLFFFIKYLYRMPFGGYSFILKKRYIPD